MFLSVFHNCPAAVAQFIDQSTTSLQIAVCWFTHPGIFKTLKQAHQRGVKIDLVINYDQVNFSPQGLDFQNLLLSGATIYGYKGPGLMHHKLAVADGSKVLTGSFNWTRSEQNDHLLLIESPELALSFQEAFEAVVLKAVPLALLRDIPPNFVSFAQLHQPIIWSPNDIKKRVISGAKSWLAFFKSDQEWQQALSAQQYTLPTRHQCNLPTAAILNDPEALRLWLKNARMPGITRTRIARYCLRAKTGDIIVAMTFGGAFLGVGLLGSDPGLSEQGDICRFVPWLVKKDTCFDAATSGKRPVNFLPFKGSVLALLSEL